jgi:hypothetical protein
MSCLNQSTARHGSRFGFVLGVLLLSGSLGFAREQAMNPDLSRINDGKAWMLINASPHAVSETGTSVVRMKPAAKPNTPSNVGLALVNGVEFSEGTLEIDLKGRGPVERCFLGVAFNVADGKKFEAVYFRPFNFRPGEYSTPTHAVQYVAWPAHTWEQLRKGQPGVYESTVKPVPDPAEWFHARVEVSKRKVRVFVGDAKEPCLSVNRLAGGDKGKVGLWVDGREGVFRNLRIQPTQPN